MMLLIFAVALLLAVSVVGVTLGNSNPRPFLPGLPSRPTLDNRAGSATTSVTAPTEAAATDLDPTDSDPSLAEAGLAARRMTGQLSPADYQQAMAQLAADDAASRPIVTPPKPSP